ncbi:N-acetylneuraminic acid mutarotase [Flavobacterium arsenatis]|uniref:N-acetylneuraminic acid mutarotase n=1 Tax=Flavobacterium arsenatis TaxID=1484332 RepID=A0ABU1TNY5_9FLAO|nr:T9SS type A sorting domain-containing protein [Flavobacterium arsenatis]MDR6967163.1 N-acetylneuraminic acid mutarotase [Flavobacterium arsenatis]
MKTKQLKVIMMLLVLVVTNDIFSQTESSFVRKQPLGNQFVGRSNAGLIEFNNHLYIYGGFTGANIQDFAKYNLSNNDLTKLEQMPTSGTNKKGKSTFKVDNYMYHFDVYGTGVSRYNLQSDVWEYNIVSMPPVAFTAESGFVIGATVYLTTSYTGSNAFWAFDTESLTWAQKADYPDASGKRGTFAFTVNGKGYYGGGRNYQTDGCTTNSQQPGCYFNYFYEYDPETNVWEQKANMPLSLVGGVAVGVEGKGYVGLGTRNDPASPYNQGINTNIWYEYNPTTDIWTAKQNFMNSDSTSDFYTSISEASITAVGSDIYVFGGHVRYFSSTYLSNDNLYKYNTLTDEWTSVDEELGGNRKEAMGVFVNGKLYAGGGQDGEETSDFHEYDPQNDSWQQKASFPIKFSNVGATSIGNKGYFIGGYQRVGPTGSSLYTSKFFEYDASSDVWTEKENYPGGSRRSLVVENYNDEVYAGFGFNGSGGFVQGFYKYNPTSDTWTPLALPSFNISYSSGFHANSFVAGDYLYLIVNGGSEGIKKYSFQNNVWTDIAIDLYQHLNNQYVNMAFSYEGKGYLVFNETSDSMKKLMAFNTEDNTLSFVSKIPFYASNQVIVKGDDGVFFAFGETTLGDITGYQHSNQLWKWIPNPEISTETGIYFVQNNTSSCGITFLQDQHTVVTDNSGDLFLKLQGGTQGNAVCIEVNSINGNYRELIGDFGEGTTTALYANKSFLQKSSQINSGNTVRLYFTDEELEDFVTSFNTTYNETKTINDIKIISHYDSNNALNADHNPLNNLFFATSNPTQSLYKIFSPTIGDYSNGKYLEALANTENSYLLKEVYVVLFSNNNLSVNNLKSDKIKIYPNPVSDMLFIKMENFESLTLLDLSGKQLLKQNEKAVDLSGLSSGIYVINLVDTNGNKYIEKVIKQ